MIDYARMSMVRAPIAIYLQQMSTPGLDRQRIQEFFERHRVNGEDAKAFYDRIAKTSRPEALELDDVELVIKIDARCSERIQRIARPDALSSPKHGIEFW